MCNLVFHIDRTYRYPRVPSSERKYLLHTTTIRRYTYHWFNLSLKSHQDMIAFLHPEPCFPLDSNARLVRASTTRLAGYDLARRPGIAGWDIKSWVPDEEVPRSKKQRHRLCRHDGVIFWRREVRDAKCVPKHNVLVVDLLAWIGVDPLW